MVRITLRNGQTGQLTFLIGMSKIDVENLQANNCAAIELGPMGGPAGSELVMAYGETDDAVIEVLREVGFPVPLPSEIPEEPPPPVDS